MCMSAFPVCIYVCHVHVWCPWKPEEDTGFSEAGHLKLDNWSYGHLWAAIWVLWTNSGSPARAASTPPSQQCYLCPLPLKNTLWTEFLFCSLNILPHKINYINCKNFALSFQVFHNSISSPLIYPCIHPPIHLSISSIHQSNKTIFSIKLVPGIILGAEDVL